MNKVAALYALMSALLFGVSTPAAKILVGNVDPIMLAGILYCGAGVGVAVLRRVGIVRRGNTSPTLRRADLPWLAGAIAAGGIAGPILLMAGLARTEASTASLLLALEGAATALLAWFVFHEGFDRRIVFGMLCLIAGAVVLAWSGVPTIQGIAGPLAIIAASIMWGLDNNLTRKVSLSDPLQIVELKGLIAGPTSLAIALWTGASFPSLRNALAGAGVGFLGYGVSLALFVLALRHLGAARTGAYFSTAPFIGAATAIAILGEPITIQLFLAGLLMGIGVWLHLTEEHDHEHVHEPLVHTHSHVHDRHHRHAHKPGDPPGEPHTHEHEHGWLRHAHPHAPDMHHNHRH